MKEMVETERQEFIGRPPTEQGQPPARPLPRPVRRATRRFARAVMLVAALLVAIALYFIWNYYSVRESTDDAQIEGHIHPISAKVGGTIGSVNFEENQHVESGAVLAQITTKDYQIALEGARGDLAEAEAALNASQINLPMTATTTSSRLSGAEAAAEEARANLSSSEKEVGEAEAKWRAAQARFREKQANAQKADRDLDRMKLLIGKEEISQQQYDAAVAVAEAQRGALDSAQADVTVGEQGLRVAESHVERDRAKLAQAQAAVAEAGTAPQQVAVTRSRAESAAARVQIAKAALDRAELAMQYTTIRAPISGLVSKKSVEVGQIIQAGQPLLAIVSLDDTWVEANFKETQLKNIRPGQPAEISVDAYGGRIFEGHVESIAAATGAKFSLLPPENATGNYVKVVQRIPVKIVFEKGQDPGHLLRPGMSVEPTVFTNK